jgi:hypothetical protein
MRTLDELRAAFPYLGFGLYALDPDGPVTLEIHVDGEVYDFTAGSEAAAIALAFPATVPAIDVFT